MVISLKIKYFIEQYKRYLNVKHSAVYSLSQVLWAVLKENPELARRLQISQKQVQMGRAGQYGSAQEIEYLLSQFPK